MAESPLDKLLRHSRKRYRWALGTDVILIIIFVLVCSLSY
jgi:serine/threonine protein kinase